MKCQKVIMLNERVSTYCMMDKGHTEPCELPTEVAKRLYPAILPKGGAHAKNQGA